jgi:hypothetical protein
LTIKFTRRGYIEVWRGEEMVSQHTQEREAVESISARGPGDYRITYPEVAVRVIGTLAEGGDTQAPSVPQNVVATAVNKNEIDVSWDASTDNVGVTGYHVFANSVPQPEVTDGTSTTLLGLEPSTLYSITVAAFDAAGNTSAESTPGEATTPANAAPVWSAIADQDVITGESYSLDLSGYVTDEDTEDTFTYTVASGTLPSGLSLAGSLVSGTPTTAGQSSTVVFRVDDGNDTADLSVDYASWSADATAPPVPTGLTANAVSSSQINLSWTASTDASGGAGEYVSGTQDYRVYRDGGLRATTSSTSYSDTGLSADTEYSYRVSARDVELNESSQSSAVAETTTSTSASDWDSRISGPGVVWYHNFESAAEVDAFRWGNGTGNDPDDEDAPNIMRWVSTDGFDGGGCMERIRPVGTSESHPDWWRPLAPFEAPGNGRATDDPAANGTLTLQTWAPTQGGSQTANFETAYYGHENYHAAYPGAFDGTEFWLQVRVKIDPNRAVEANDFNGGKIFYFTRTDRSLTAQEVVTNLQVNRGLAGTWYGGAAYLNMYRDGSPPLRDDSPGIGTHGYQPGGELGDVGDGLCRFDDNGGRLANCWDLPLGEWITLLYHVRHGTNGENNTLVELYAAPDGELEFTRVWKQPGVDLGYNTGFPFGHNALICSGFHNGRDVGVEFYHRWTQIIFSKHFIPAPGVSDTALGLACAGLASNGSVSFVPGTQHDMDSPSGANAEQRLEWQTNFYHDPIHNIVHLMGKSAQNEGGSTDWRHRIYDIALGTWSNVDNNFGRNGHVYDSWCIDPSTGDVYINPTSGGDRDIWRRNYQTGTWSQATTEMAGGSTTNGPNGLAWHPNMYGSGDGAVVVLTQSGGQNSFCFYRPLTGTAERVVLSAENAIHPQATYFPGLDLVLAGRTIHFTAEPNSGSTPTTALVSSPPLITAAQSSGTDNCGILMAHPGNPDKLLMIERSGSDRWYYSTDAVNWTLGGTHPFSWVTGTTNVNSSTFCSLEGGLGCVWGIGVQGSTLRSILWRPPV